MDKIVFRSFCVISYIVPAVMYPVMLYIIHMICRFTVISDVISYCSCYDIAPYMLLHRTACCYTVPYAVISYSVMLYRTVCCFIIYVFIILTMDLLSEKARNKFGSQAGLRTRQPIKWSVSLFPRVRKTIRPIMCCVSCFLTCEP